MSAVAHRLLVRLLSALIALAGVAAIVDIAITPQPTHRPSRQTKLSAQPEPPGIDDERRALEELGEIIGARPLFAANRRPDVSGPIEDGAPSSGELTLQGTVIGRDGAAALIVDGRGGTHLLHVGEGLSGWQILEIAPGTVRIARDQDERLLSVKPDDAAAPSERSGAAPTAGKSTPEGSPNTRLHNGLRHDFDPSDDQLATIEQQLRQLNRLDEGAIGEEN